MNPGIGAPELLVLLVLALVVVGPRDLPLMMRKVGRFVGQARSMAREFQKGFDELGREAEMAELKKEIEALKDSNPAAKLRRELKDVESEIRDLKSEVEHPRVKKPISPEDARIIADKERAARDAMASPEDDMLPIEPPADDTTGEGR